MNAEQEEAYGLLTGIGLSSWFAYHCVTVWVDVSEAHEYLRVKGGM